MLLEITEGQRRIHTVCLLFSSVFFPRLKEEDSQKIGHTCNCGVGQISRGPVDLVGAPSEETTALLL
jgi:hypothetical protein